MPKLQRFTVLLLAAGVLGAAAASVAEADPMLKICAGCHGDDGLGTDSDTPIIAGLPALVQEDAIYAYIDGDRSCGQKPMMCKAVSKLREEQVVELAEHFAAMPYEPAGEDFDSALAAKGKNLHDNACAICHGADDPGNAEASILHGQRKNYLRYALQQYADGVRKQLPAMEKATSVLSEADIEALLNYYASYRN